MPTLVNRLIQTGREILKLEQLMDSAPTMLAGDRRHLSDRHTALMSRQQAQIVDAVNAGVCWDTITFALALHGQDADRDQHRGEPSTAAVLQAVVAAYEPEKAMAILTGAASSTRCA